MSERDTGATDGSNADYRQVAFAVLALAGLVLAAFVAPAAPGQGPAGDGGSGERVDGGAEPGDGGDGPGGDGLLDLLRRLLELLGTDAQRTGSPQPGEEPPCRIVLDREPVPGATVTVTVRRAGRPVPDATVWFNGRRIGRTDRFGEVTGRVPYSRQLRVRVVADSLSGCEGAVATGRMAVPGAGAGVAAAGSVASGAMAAGVAPSGVVAAGTVAATGASQSDDGADDGDGNVSISRSVRGEVAIEVLDRPYPGESVTVEATIEGVPMRRATVTLGGERVAETDERGRAAVPIPEGSDRVRLTVSRGDFSGTVVVDVYLLEATLRPAGVVLVPGGGATVVAEAGGDPVSGAEVTLEGERLGSTGPDGELALVLPADPTAPVTVSTDRQTTSVSLLGLYWLPASLAGVVAAAASGVAYRSRGRRGLLAVLGLLGALGIVVVSGGYGGARGSLLAAVGLGGVGLLAGLIRYRRRVAGGTATVGGAIARIVETVVRWVLWLVGGLERLLDYGAAAVERLVAWARSLPRSVSGLIARLAGGIGALPKRAAAALRAAPPTRVGAALVGGLAVGGGYLVDGPRGGALVGAAAALAGAGWWLLDRETPSSAGETSEDATDSTVPSRPADGDGSRTLRELWRAFARRVVPDRWRTRTPAEVARAAIEQGYPTGPVRELATAFREVEYGNRSLTATVRDRIERAYDALVGGRDGGPAARSGADAGEEPPLEGERS